MRLSLNKTYNDLLPIISSQEFVHSFKLYNNESIDIDMTNFRKPIRHFRKYKTSH